MNLAVKFQNLVSVDDMYSLRNALNDVEYLLTKAKWEKENTNAQTIIYSIVGHNDEADDSKSVIRLERSKGGNYKLRLSNRGVREFVEIPIDTRGFKDAQDKSVIAILCAMRDNGFRPQFGE